MKYDIFISYRREGGYDTAKHLNDLLVRDGYKVSFDIDTLRDGDFDTQLLTRIEQCKDFILIVDKHAFDRTLDPTFDSQKDWLRCELAHALKHRKNIVPIFLSGVNGFPDGLPADIAGVVKKNGPEYNRYHFNAFYKDLKKRFLKSKSAFGKYIALLAIVLLVLLVGVFGSDKTSESEDVVQDTLSSTYQEEFNKENLREESQEQTSTPKINKEDILRDYCGSFSFVAPGIMSDAITYVYTLELDPLHSTCEWIEEDLFEIRESKGYCGTHIKGTEAWEVLSFNLHESGSHVLVEMKRLYDTFEGRLTEICKLKLELDEYKNIRMTYVSGDKAPSPLYDGEGIGSALFVRDENF